MLVVTVSKDNTVENVAVFAENNEKGAWEYFFSELVANGGEVVDGVHRAAIIDVEQWMSENYSCHIQLHRVIVGCW